MLKFPLFDISAAAFDDIVTIKMPPPLPAQFLGMQNGVVTLWAMDAGFDYVERTFHIAGTGHGLPLSPSPCYVGTVLDRVFVWHIFELFQFSAVMP